MEGRFGAGAPERCWPSPSEPQPRQGRARRRPSSGVRYRPCLLQLRGAPGASGPVRRGAPNLSRELQGTAGGRGWAPLRPADSQRVPLVPLFLMSAGISLHFSLVKNLRGTKQVSRGAGQRHKQFQCFTWWAARGQSLGLHCLQERVCPFCSVPKLSFYSHILSCTQGCTYCLSFPLFTLIHKVARGLFSVLIVVCSFFL